jgi:hypothetical protein
MQKKAATHRVTAFLCGQEDLNPTVSDILSSPPGPPSHPGGAIHGAFASRWSAGASEVQVFLAFYAKKSGNP